MSYSTLLRRMKLFRLSRRNYFTKNKSPEIFEKARNRIIEMINGPESSGGYRSVWHSSEIEVLRIPRVVVQDLLKELDSDGVNAREAHRLKKRVLSGPGILTVTINSNHEDSPFIVPLMASVVGFYGFMLLVQIILLITKLSWSQTLEQKMQLSQQPRAIFEIIQILIDMLFLHVTNETRGGDRFFLQEQVKLAENILSRLRISTCY